ncbi:hypothetical protein DL240_07020 [Lujinxingia litoralis]|uniref:Uncharacterized protein n=1 Tax=Lujinxingia litoralis TaxID=2211119 RepID=A0A328C7Q1_9DELT|nr:hypothetical protein [Lujinxingia litoralis]RAL23893.1 hypothetical protein DL240_07020 [Lujinxingia litoralis]
MAERSPNSSHIYPEPTLVIGVGRFGLALLEKLGQEWRGLSQAASDDPSIKNLRLLSVLPDPTSEEHRWRLPEAPLARIALAAGEDDLPTLALHFAIIRALGLIRFHNGTYQLAVPRDHGAVEKNDRHSIRRRRFFSWHPLDSDPRRAPERLHRLATRDPEVDLFLTPIVERVLHGQSPRLLLNLIARYRAYTQGRDPSPWPWLAPHLPHDRTPGTDTHLSLPFSHTWWHEDDHHPSLLGHLPPAALPDDSQPPPPIHIPSIFAPVPGDLTSPLSPRRLLSIDWETSGWVAGELQKQESVEFFPLDLSPYRLGLFDHDDSPGLDLNASASALKELGELVHRGLLRIWLDLQRERHEDPMLSLQERRRVDAETSAEQCLELLGELVLHPLLRHEGDLEHTPVSHRPNRWVDGPPLPATPSPALQKTLVDIEATHAARERPLLQRLRSLGLNFELDELGHRPLLQSISLHPDDLRSEARLTKLRSAVNEEARHLLSFDHLTSYRRRASRQPPRLTVYLVAEAKDPFTRRALRPILRAIHQELIRAYRPLLDTGRQGFDRSLSIVPILWTPHPADAFGADHPDANLTEEAAILAAVHDLRRWVEALPAGHRCVPQIFINSRVNAGAVLGLDDALRQTHDFISLQIRNELGRDPWLRQTAEGFGDHDIFATFSCVKIEFPAERAREYLANRLAREALLRLRSSTPRQTDTFETSPILPLESIPPLPDALLEPPRQRLDHLAAATADRLASDVDDRIHLSAHTTTAELANRFDNTFEDHLFDRVHSAWKGLTRQRGEMDQMIDSLRQQAAAHLHRSLALSRKNADVLIDERASKGGLAAALAGFNLLHQHSRTLLDEAEHQRIQAQRLCLRHSLPDPTPIAQARRDLLTAAESKPDLRPLLVGAIFLAIIAPALGAPLAHALARALNLHQQPNLIEPLLGPGGWLIGGLALFLPAAWLLHRHLHQHLDRVRNAINALNQAVRNVVHGRSRQLFSESPSIHSFFAARLLLSHALAQRNFADRLHDSVDADRNRAFRLIQSVELQERLLRQHAESLGARPSSTPELAPQTRLDDDLRALFQSDPNAPDAPLSLLAPEHLLEHYLRHFPAWNDIDATLPALLSQAGGFQRWRHQACLADTHALLAFGRDHFEELRATPLGAQPAFEARVGTNLTHFVAFHYANLGFGARFTGFEGFDTSGIRTLANTALLIHPQLLPAFERARLAPNAHPTTETLDLIEANILPNTAFMISLVQGINARSIQTLRRHETFFDRLELPDSASPWQKHSLTIASRHALEPSPDVTSPSLDRSPGTHTHPPLDRSPGTGKTAPLPSDEEHS